MLVAIAIPVFTGQLDKSMLATATANVRSAYTEYVAASLSNNTEPVKNGFSYSGYDTQGCTVTVGDSAITVKSLKGVENTIPVQWGSAATRGTTTGGTTTGG